MEGPNPAVITDKLGLDLVYQVESVTGG